MTELTVGKSNKFLDTAENYLFLVPALAIFSVFWIYPFYDIFRLSFFEWRGIGPENFVGARNFSELFSDRVWWTSIWNATYITVWALTFQNVMAFMLALACDRNIRMKNVYRVIFFIPPVLSQIVVGLLWRWILNPEMHNGVYIGLLNNFLSHIGLTHLAHNWLTDPKTALTSIAVVHCWQGFGWGFVILLAGLQTIDRQLYEAARVDGASAWTTFWHITIPAMMPVILIVIILTILGSMQAFMLVLSMVSQGLVDYTEVPVTQILRELNNRNFGYACAMGVHFAMILIAFSLAMKFLSNKPKQV